MKQKLRKITSVLLAVIIISVITMSPITASALTQSEFDSKLNSLRSKYPNYSTWCSSFDGGSQCFGFARLIGYEVFGSYPSTWSVSYDFNSVKTGDIIRYGNNGSGGHSIFVTNVSGSTITFVDCNGNGNVTNGVWIPDKCVVKWDNTTTIGNSLFGYSFSYIRKSPGIESRNNPPVISEQKILAYDSGGYMLQCYVTDDTGVSSVKAATWTSKNGQDDLIWETMVNTEANTWKLYISYSNHNNEIGSYVNHIYAYDIQGNETSSEVVFCNDFEPPKITEAKIKAQDKNGYLISCKAEDNLGISNVKAAVWTLNNSQDDLIWDNMVNNGNGIWELYIPYKSHNCEEGFYRTHIYAYDDNNNSCSIAVDDLLVSIDINDYIPSNTVYYDNTKYEYFNYNTTWKQAEKICNLYGGHLVTITSQKEQDFINQLISNYSNQFCWVGATDENSEGKWKWITGEEFSYTNWATNEPNNANGEENYMHLNNSGRWNDIHYTGNEYTFSFICEYDKIDPNDYIPYQSIEFDGKKYEFFDYSLTWEQASNVCEQKGGHLVTIGSDKENDIIWNTINNSSIEKFWIGATDKITESNWEWITGEPIEYTNWNSEEPNNSKGFENYAEIISSSGKWNDVYNYANINSLKYGFICEYEQTTIIGDVSSDGVISIADATTLQKYLANIVNFDDEQLAVADTNGDGSVSIADATQIQKYLAQLIPSLG